MRRDELAPLATWLIEPVPPDAAAVIDRLRRAPGVRRVAVMPDVHLASDVCVGTVVAADDRLYPQAVGGDIGCGVLSVRVDGAGPARLADAATAGRVLAGIARAVPTLRRQRAAIAVPPDDLAAMPLSHGWLEAVRRDDGALQLGTLGSGNHFVELQADEEDRLWLTIHSGSRAIGQAVREHHVARAEPVGGGLRALDAASPAGRAYLADVAVARRYADANRREIAARVGGVLSDELGATLDPASAVSADHNHVRPEEHFGRPLFVHRKGAMPADAGAVGVLPGSMGTASFHVAGRGCAEALRSSAHGAGRAMSREAARRAIPVRDVHRQLAGVWYDYRIAPALREEAPAAYKDVRAVLRAQRDLVKVVRTLRPVLNYKGR